MPVEAIRPLVIRADQPRALPASCLADLRTPMPAGVIKAAQLAVLATDDDDWRTANCEGEMRAGLRQLWLEAHEKPIAAVDRQQIEFEYVGIDVKALRQRMTRLALVEQQLKLCKIWH